jgi:hypothetical protein
MLSSSQRTAVRVHRHETLGWPSGFHWRCDAAAVAVFRNAHLPPFPPGTPAQPADVVVTLHYHPADSGG